MIHAQIPAPASRQLVATHDSGCGGADDGYVLAFT
jgi:hypothetical protein